MRAFIPLAVLVVSAAILNTGGCPSATTGGGPGNTTGTTTIAEFLPSEVTLEISELPEDANDVAVNENEQGMRRVYDRVVRSSATIVHRFHRLADKALALGAAVRDDVTDPNDPTIAGTFRVAGVDVAYKADFTAFDFDGDGTADGSGNMVDLPIAVRIWTDRGDGYARFLCALVTAKPSTENIGSGEFYVQPAAAHAEAPADVQIFVQYDRTDATHKWNQAFITGRIHPRYGLTDGAARVDVRPNAAGDLEKTVRGSHNYDDNPYGFTTFQSAVHYVVGGTALLASAQATAGESEVSFTDVCVDLAERELLTDGSCDDFDTQDMNFLDVPAGDETAWPAGFHETPTF